MDKDDHSILKGLRAKPGEEFLVLYYDKFDEHRPRQIRMYTATVREPEIQFVLV